MKATYIYGIIAAGALLTAPSCSDNYDTVVKPVVNDLELTVDGHAGAFTVNYGAAPDNNIQVAVNSNTLWNVSIQCEGGWCTSDRVTGRGDETFTLSILENINKERDAFITISMVDKEGEPIVVEGKTTSIMMTLKQAVSDVRLAPSSLPPFPATDNASQSMTIEANVAWTLDVTYEGENTTEFVTITPRDGMNAAANGTFSGEGKASFELTLADNRTAADRRAFLNLRSVIATYTVEIRQIKSDYTFDVSPTETRMVGAEGGQLSFEVYSQEGWDVIGNDWIKFSPSGADSGSAGRVRTVATVAPNPEGEMRSAQVYFVPKSGADNQVAVTIIQQSFPMTFGAARIDSQGVVTDKGEEVAVDVNSTFRWSVESPSWIELGSNSGSGNGTFGAYVRPNYSGENRTGFIVITPEPTSVGGVMLYPEAFGYGAIHIGVTQFGGREAAISVPWLRDGYTQTSATVEFNYYSPYYGIVEAGLEYVNEATEVSGLMTVTPKDGTEGTASFDLTGLDPATRYIARGYVKDENGNIKYGEWSYPFTTAGQYPNAGDNPTPSR